MDKGPKEELVSFSMQMPRSLADRLDKYAARENRSRASTIRHMVEHMLLRDSLRGGEK